MFSNPFENQKGVCSDNQSAEMSGNHRPSRDLSGDLFTLKTMST